MIGQALLSGGWWWQLVVMIREVLVDWGWQMEAAVSRW
jgi:hypothetical protein